MLTILASVVAPRTPPWAWPHATRSDEPTLHLLLQLTCTSVVNLASLYALQHATNPTSRRGSRAAIERFQFGVGVVIGLAQK